MSDLVAQVKAKRRRTIEMPTKEMGRMGVVIEEVARSEMGTRKMVIKETRVLQPRTRQAFGIPLSGQRRIQL